MTARAARTPQMLNAYGMPRRNFEHPRLVRDSPGRPTPGTP